MKYVFKNQESYVEKLVRVVLLFSRNSSKLKQRTIITYILNCGAFASVKNSMHFSKF